LPDPLQSSHIPPFSFIFSVLSDKFKQFVGKMSTSCSWVRGVDVGALGQLY
jgi:hypothetical protein